MLQELVVLFRQHVNDVYRSLQVVFTHAPRCQSRCTSEGSACGFIFGMGVSDNKMRAAVRKLTLSLSACPLNHWGHRLGSKHTTQ